MIDKCSGHVKVFGWNDGGGDDVLRVCVSVHLSRCLCRIFWGMNTCLSACICLSAFMNVFLLEVQLLPYTSGIIFARRNFQVM